MTHDERAIVHTFTATADTPRAAIDAAAAQLRAWSEEPEITLYDGRRKRIPLWILAVDHRPDGTYQYVITALDTRRAEYQRWRMSIFTDIKDFGRILRGRRGAQAKALSISLAPGGFTNEIVTRIVRGSGDYQGGADTAALQATMAQNELVYACVHIKAQSARDPRLDRPAASHEGRPDQL